MLTGRKRGNQPDEITTALAKALLGLVAYVDGRDDSDEDDDVRALEDVAHILGQIPKPLRPALVQVLGEEAADEMGLLDT